ncbi:hypothetical protein BGZ63DRAFT_398631 [Mariannaea sp. PMI_226]|nr:hypothetical protein BGZ63DRAFT_398631 [Mariannaea sp. PMI_226]
MQFSTVLLFAGAVVASQTPAATPCTTSTGNPIYPTHPAGDQKTNENTTGNSTVHHTGVNTPVGHPTGTGSGSAPTVSTGAAPANGVQGSVAALLGLVAAGIVAL